MMGHCKTYRDTGPTGSHARTLILTLNLTLSLNPKALPLTLNPIWCDPVDLVSLYVLQPLWWPLAMEGTN